MRWHLAMAATIGLITATSVLEVEADPRGVELIRQARVAVGGEAALQKAVALTATGTVRRLVGNDFRVEGDLTIHLALPDRMLRTESISPDGGVTLVSDQGINGTTLIRNARTFNVPPGAVLRTPPPPAPGSDAEAQAIRASRADLARLTLALLVRSPDSAAVDYNYAGEAESPDGLADVVEIKATDGTSFTARLFLDRATHRPLMLTYRGASPRMVVQTRRLDGPPPDGPPPPPNGARAPALPPPASEVVDIEMFLDDYRAVNGLLLPHRIARSVAGEITEEWLFKSIAINPSFKPGTFDGR